MITVCRAWCRARGRGRGLSRHARERTRQPKPRLPYSVACSLSELQYSPTMSQDGASPLSRSRGGHCALWTLGEPLLRPTTMPNRALSVCPPSHPSRSPHNSHIHAHIAPPSVRQPAPVGRRSNNAWIGEDRACPLPPSRLSPLACTRCDSNSGERLKTRKYFSL